MLLDGEGYAKDVLGLFARFSRAVLPPEGRLGEPPLVTFKREWRQLDFSRVHELRGEEDPWTFLQTLYAGMIRPLVVGFDRAVAQGKRGGDKAAGGDADGAGGAAGASGDADPVCGATDGSEFLLADDGFPLVYELVGSECMAAQTIRDEDIPDKVLLTGVASLYGLFCVYETQVRLVTDVPVRVAVAPDAWSRLAAVALCARRRRWGEPYRVWLFLLRHGMALHAALLTEQSVSMAIGSTADGVDEAEEEDEEAASRVIADVEVADAIDVHAIDSSVRAYLVARRKFELMPDHEMSNTFYRVGTNFGSAIRGVLEQYRDASEVIDAEEQARRMRERKTRTPSRPPASVGETITQSRMVDLKPAKRGDMPQVGSASKPQTVLKSPRPRATRVEPASGSAERDADAVPPPTARRGSRRSTDDGDLIETLQEMLNESSDDDASEALPAPPRRGRGRPKGSTTGKGKAKGKTKSTGRPRGRPPKAVPGPASVPMAPASAIPGGLMAQVQAQEEPAAMPEQPSEPVVEDLTAPRGAALLVAEDGDRAQQPLGDLLAAPVKRGRGRPKGSTTKRKHLDATVDPNAPRATRQRKTRKPLEM